LRKSKFEYIVDVKLALLVAGVKLIVLCKKSLQGNRFLIAIGWDPNK